MKYCNTILDTIGDTPIVKINRLTVNKLGSIYAKLECFNPGRSVKDRIACNMLQDAEKAGSLSKGMTIIESSSGNTGIGLSLASRVKGYKNIIVVDKNCPGEKIKLLKALGATVVMVTTNGDTAEDLTQKRIEFVKQARVADRNLFTANQYGNPSAPAAHYLYTAKEIIQFMEDTGIHFDTVMLSVGTGGTITGISKRLKQYDQKIRIIGVEPMGSTLFGGLKGAYFQQGPGNYFVPENLEYRHIDAGMKASDSEAFNMCRKLALKEGLLMGGSSGGVMAKAVEIADRYPGNILCVLPDGGEKYLDTIYSDEWLSEHGIELDEDNVNAVLELNIDRTPDYTEFIDNLLYGMTGTAEKQQAIPPQSVIMR